jgi:DNA-directed RNA polymerase specialized sigma24 family protein
VHVRRRDVAEEVVQDAWIAVMGGLDGYERRSSLRTWVLGIVIDVARSRGARRGGSSSRRSRRFHRPTGNMEGLPAGETCNMLAISDTKQRVRPHRTRSRVRKAIESYFEATEPT